jgi:hypothetical protein
MIKKMNLKIIIYLLISANVFGQIKVENNLIDFGKIAKELKETHSWRQNDKIIDSTNYKNILYNDSDFNISISQNPIEFETKTLIYKNPYFTEEKNSNNKIRKKNYPISNSIILENNLISLFENGEFVCLKFPDFKRNIELEDKLNQKKFSYHWIINDNLNAISDNILYIWKNDEWVESEIEFPLEKQPILYEDNEYIVFSNCRGEFGGNVYFFDKKTSEIYFIESTCTNSVLKKNGKYFILAHLGHMIGFSEEKIVENPRKLTKVNKEDLNKKRKRIDIEKGIDDNSEAFTEKLKMSGIQLFSTFIIDDRQLYIVFFGNNTFLAEIKGTKIEIVHQLFNDNFYTHNPVTKKFGNYKLINLNFYGIAIEREISVIVIKDKKITKLDWNENHSR